LLREAEARGILTVVRACLNAMPVGLAEVAPLDDSRDPGQVGRIDCAKPGEPEICSPPPIGASMGLHDEQLGDELVRWLRVKPRLA
jgi:hypothetical protein